MFLNKGTVDIITMIHREAVVFGGPGGLSHGAFFAHVAILASMLFAMLPCSVDDAFKPKQKQGHFTNND